jgi:predicted MFS family arabinose efflux permease
MAIRKLSFGASAPTPIETSTTPRLFTPAFVALSLAELAYFTAQGLTIPTTPLFARGPLGSSEAGIGLAVGAFAVTALLLRPYAGRLSDRIGRRPLLIWGAVGVAVTLAAHVVVTDLAALVALRLLLGVAEAFFFVAGFAAVADLAPEGRTGEAISFNSLSLYLGIALGPVIGHQLLDLGGFAIAWLGGAGLAVAAAVLATRIPETRRQTTDHVGPTPLVHRSALAPSLALCSGLVAMAGFLAFVTIHATENLRLDGASGVLFLFGMTVVVSRVVLARLPDRVQPFRLGAVALTLNAAGLLVIVGLGSVAGLAIGALVLGVGVALTTPAFFAAVFARVDPAERGSASGTASLFIDLAFGVGPMLLGVVAGLGGIPAAFVVAATITALGAVGSGLLAVRDRRRDGLRVIEQDGVPAA